MIAEHRRYCVRLLRLPLDLRRNPRAPLRKEIFWRRDNPSGPGSLLFPAPIALPPVHSVPHLRVCVCHVLGEAVDVADIPVMIIVGHVDWRRAARSSDVATRGGGGATQRLSLSTCHPDGAPVLLEEDATTVTKFLAVRLITKGRKIVFCLFVG